MATRKTTWSTSLAMPPRRFPPPWTVEEPARQALLHMTDQVTYLAWAIGQAEYYRPCYSVFACGGPYATTIGAEPMIEHDLTTQGGATGRAVMALPHAPSQTPPPAPIETFARYHQGSRLHPRTAQACRGQNRGRPLGG